MANTIQIEVAYALEEEQFLYAEGVDEGCTVIVALKQSALLVEFPDLSVDKVGIFGKLVTYETVLRAGDRIEVYRPLKADPRDRRRKQVEQTRKASK
jgi:hypothetical protein